MKNLLLFILIISTGSLFANGVAVVNAETGSYLHLSSSIVEVNVENQVAIITSEQTFKNNSDKNVIIKYAFPMPEDGSVTSLYFKINGMWRHANFSPIPQDTSLPGQGETIKKELKAYLGKTPFYFNVFDTVKIDSAVTFRVTYVQLLKYVSGKVQFNYPNDYSLIQTDVLEKQQLIFNISSQRTIDSLYVLSHTIESTSNGGKNAQLKVSTYESPADINYKVEYSLNSSELGLFSLSTSIADTLVPDNKGKGFFLFIAEPNPNQSNDVIKKVFTIIIDRSGSMFGTKMEQAKNAAGYIINNLNEGDDFNIIDFSTEVNNFRSAHVAFNAQNRDAALQYISNLSADGLTNISGAFEKAIPQFSGSSQGAAKIIIFLTDGQPTVGLTGPNDILTKVNSLVKNSDTLITVFNFGIGTDVNYQLLTLLSAQHNGLVEFLENNQLEERLTQFYSKIRNPVLINTKMSFSPNIITETYPNPLPNLYKGQQLLVSGRYNQATPGQVTLNGTAFGKNVSYTYNLNLADSSNNRYQFLTKVWAKVKIENLLVEYYKLNSGLLEAMKLKEQIIKLSLLYGVMSPFTSLTGNDPGGPSTEVNEDSKNSDHNNNAGDFTLLGNYPNPFNPGTYITFNINKYFAGIAVIKIYNSIGELIRTLHVQVDRSGTYRIYWDGRLEGGITAPSGTYIYTISFNSTVLAGKMSLLK